MLAQRNALDYLALDGAWAAAEGQRLLADAVREAGRARVDGLTRRLGILGHGLAHSRSPRLHQQPFDRIDLPADAPLEELLDALHGHYRGLAITNPFKKRIAAIAQAGLPAVNTLVRSAGGWHAENSDVAGADAVLAALGGARVTVLGDGGVTAALRLAAAQRGVELEVITRAQVTARPVSGPVVWTWPALAAAPEALRFEQAQVAVVAYGAPARQIARDIIARGGTPRAARAPLVHRAGPPTAQPLGVSHMNTFGELFRVTTFGESHGPGLGAVIDGCPAGVPLTTAQVQRALDRRRPGQSAVTTARAEADAVELLSGVYEDKTLGTPIAALVRNVDQRSQDYAKLAKEDRPGHADRVWRERFQHRDPRGGGRTSGRETLCRVIGGAVAEAMLARELPAVTTVGWVSQVGPLVLPLPGAVTRALVDAQPDALPRARAGRADGGAHPRREGEGRQPWGRGDGACRRAPGGAGGAGVRQAEGAARARGGQHRRGQRRHLGSGGSRGAPQAARDPVPRGACRRPAERGVRRDPGGTVQRGAAGAAGVVQAASDADGSRQGGPTRSLHPSPRGSGGGGDGVDGARGSPSPHPRQAPPRMTTDQEHADCLPLPEGERVGVRAVTP